MYIHSDTGFIMQKLDKEQELFTITMEECGELIQCCSKAMRRWELYKNSDSEISLKEEIGDVYTMISLLVEHGVISWDEIKHRETIKRKKLEQWSSLIPHPPKTEQKEKHFPSNSVTWKQSTGVDERGYGTVTYQKDYKQKMIYAHTNFSSEPMSEYEEKEWKMLEQRLEMEKNAKDS